MGSAVGFSRKIAVISTVFATLQREYQEHGIKSRIDQSFPILLRCSPCRIMIVALGGRGEEKMKIGDVITQHNNELLTCGPNHSLEEVSSLLAEHNIGILPVREAEGELQGIVSERDIVRAVAQHGPAAPALTVKDVMTRDVVVCSPQDTVMNAMALMSEHNIRHLPLVEDGILKKVISHRDLMHVSIKQFRLTMRFVDEYVNSK